jgi:hypothetical protein
VKYFYRSNKESIQELDQQRVQDPQWKKLAGTQKAATSANPSFWLGTGYEVTSRSLSDYPQTSQFSIVAFILVMKFFQMSLANELAFKSSRYWSITLANRVWNLVAWTV